jgi:hypothetical protein
MPQRPLPLLLAAALLPLLAVPLHAETAAPAPPAVAGLSTDVAVVRVVGPWSTATQRGYSRLIEVLSGGTLALYVQWIARGGNGADQIVQTMKVVGAEGVSDLPLAQIRVDAGQSGSEVQFQLPMSAQGEMQSWTLDVGGPGEAQFGRASH